jgi:hypothetical protein
MAEKRGFEPRYIFLCSIYPGQFPPQRRAYGTSIHSTGKGASRSTLFEIPPVPRGSRPPFATLQVFDSFECIPNLQQMSAQNTRARSDRPVPVEEIVDDLLACWTGNLFNVPRDAKPGLMAIAGTTPTQRELSQLEAQQTRLFEYWFHEGERHHRQNEWKEITDSMRLAAEWLGDDYRREWSHLAIARANSPCVFCGKSIPDTALVCSHCGRTVRAIPPELAALQINTPPTA